MRSRIELGARALWSLYRKHPWLAQLGPLTRPLLVPNLMVHGEWVLGALDGHGLAPTTLFDIHVLIYSHVQGLAVHLELEAHAEAATGQSEDQWMDSRAPTLRSTIPRALGRGFIVADAARRARTRSRSPGRGPALSRSAATVARRRQLVVAPRYNRRSDGALADAARAAPGQELPRR
ncbi:TetR/AcrR family transcriptional regulator C-terminal domain-containing protein [Streptomyces noursei]|uniref:TetR/AcrR family transcriptional regulator C-terminal domain-containing protein n=1 Tax=Streptomyces noursei TaxID=1971 RepID=UPI0036D3F858